ncbi:pyridoxamine 5'-phosphate oxidase family protein [Aquirufa sp.]|jgi:3-hydroxyisobutyrate dehydrogenase|uniref:pyridoxamine 5'-phosphate oxidase family protein n=1 Tax=Aquirufa sp. TaxID=2676249 RepID=UPI003784AA7C
MENSTQINTEKINFSLEDLEQDIWVRLVTGAVKSRNPFHTPCVATMDKGEISLRTVVLRKALAKERELRFHTDIRSPKWKELSLNPSISALFYDAGDRIQLRVKGKAVLHYKNDLTAEAWKNTTSSSRRCYLTLHSPSSFAEIPTSGLSEEIEQENFTLAESEMGYSNFGIVSIQVHSIDWLWLNHAGHRRAFFDYTDGSFQWMIP